VRGLEELGQLCRLNRFRAQHPGVVIKQDTGFGFWQAWIPLSNGGTVITRYGLGILLDRLDELLGPECSHGGEDAGGSGRDATPGHDDQEPAR